MSWVNQLSRQVKSSLRIMTRGTRQKSRLAKECKRETSTLTSYMIYMLRRKKKRRSIGHRSPVGMLPVKLAWEAQSPAALSLQLSTIRPIIQMSQVTALVAAL